MCQKCVVHTGNCTQVQTYDPERIIEAYKATPPEVKKPTPRGVKKLKEAGGGPPPAPQPPRIEGTRKSNRKKADPA